MKVEFYQNNLETSVSIQADGDRIEIAAQRKTEQHEGYIAVSIYNDLKDTAQPTASMKMARPQVIEMCLAFLNALFN